jgi:predicted nucleic acid-binding Zn ribbon protein
MAEKLVQHKHCRICSKAVPLDEDVCSEECQGKLDMYMRANKRKNIMVLFMMVLSFSLLFLIVYNP